MSEYTVAAKFITWVLSGLLMLGLVSQVKPMTMKLAELAIQAQENQMSYGKYSRQLWDKKKK